MISQAVSPLLPRFLPQIFGRIVYLESLQGAVATAPPEAKREHGSRSEVMFGEDIHHVSWENPLFLWPFHGKSLLLMGKSTILDGAPKIAKLVNISGLTLTMVYGRYNYN